MHSDRRSYQSDVVRSLSHYSAPASAPHNHQVPHHPRPPDRRAVADAVIKDIVKKLERKNHAKLKFIADGDLRRIIWQHANRILAFEPWDHQQVELMLVHCYQTLGILIFIGAFTQLRSIRNVFFRKGESILSPEAITNDRLWANEAQLSFLDTDSLRYAFLDQQWIFKPYTFVEEKPSKRLDVPLDARLPFIHAGEEIGTGAFGLVSAVVVAGRHYVDPNKQLYENPMYCALKQLKTPKDLLRELKQLDIIKESLIKHERVLMHHVAFTHGDTFNILLPLAKHGNVEQLLHEGFDPENPQRPPLYNFSERFPAFDWREPKCIQDLLVQITNIVDAVKWLHSGDVLKLEIIHRDLKPDNILVAEDTTTDPEKKSSIGLWQLSDLGISVLQPSVPHSPDEVRSDTVDPNNTVTIGDAILMIENGTTLNERRSTRVRNGRTSRTMINRDPGTYTAPEVEHNENTKESDVWSLLCIFAEVLAFAINGRNGVKRFEQARQKGRMDNYFYSQKPSATLAVSSDAVKYMVCPAIETWLNDLAVRNADWVKCCVQIILRSLAVEADQRPKASELYEMLLHAQDHQNGIYSATGTKCPNTKSNQTPISSPIINFSPPLVQQEHFSRVQTTSMPQLQRQAQIQPSIRPPPSQPIMHQHTNSDGYYPNFIEDDRFAPPERRTSLPLSRHMTQPMSPQTRIDRRDSSATSGNRSDVLSLNSPSLSLVLSNEEQPTIAHFQRKQAKGKVPAAIDVSICPTGEYALWLFKTSTKPATFELDLTSLEASYDEPRRASVGTSRQELPLDTTIRLTPGIEWLRVEYAHRFAVVQGKSLKKGDNTKHFCFFDLNQRPPRLVRTGNHHEMIRVGQGNMAVSSSGFAVLTANTKLLLYDLRNDASEPEVLEAKERKYWFSTTTFSPAGDRVVAWCWGEKLNDSIHLWHIDLTTRNVSPTFRYDIATHKGCQAPVQLILPSPEEYGDSSIDCIVREGQGLNGRFFTVRLGAEPDGSQTMAREYLTEEANGAVAAAVYRGTHLITLVRSSAARNGMVMSYPIHTSLSGRRRLEPTRMGSFVMPTNRRMRIIVQSAGIRIITLSLDRQFSRAWFRES